MDKKTIIILSAVLIVAIGFLIFSINFYLSKRQSTEVQPSDTVIDRNGGTADVSPAGELSDDFREIFYQARKANDPSKCNALYNTQEKKQCQDRVNITIAIEKNDMNLCRAISSSDLRDQCFINVGQESGGDYCDFLSTVEARETCSQDKNVANIIENKDVDSCLNLQEDSQRACVFAIIYNLGDVSGCSSIENQEYRTMCEDYYK